MNAVYRGQAPLVLGRYELAGLSARAVSHARRDEPAAGGRRARSGARRRSGVLRRRQRLCPRDGQMPGEGPTWIDGLTVLPDADGRERMLCGYAKIKPPLTVYRRGICEWNDEQAGVRARERLRAGCAALSRSAIRCCTATATRTTSISATPFPLVRVRATAESYRDLTSTRLHLPEAARAGQAEIDRDDGRVRYAWKRHAAGRPQSRQAVATASSSRRRLLQLATRHGQAGNAHAGSVKWNEYRDRSS